MDNFLDDYKFELTDMGKMSYNSVKELNEWLKTANGDVIVINLPKLTLKLEIYLN